MVRWPRMAGAWPRRITRSGANGSAAWCCWRSVSPPHCSAHEAAKVKPEDFITANAALIAPPLVPEIKLYLATEVVPMWRATEEELAANGVPPPYWAFAWAGGQALARYVLDHPETVAGKTVLDIGSGSGLVGIAAAMAGAAHVTSADIDVFACTAMRLNA